MCPQETCGSEGVQGCLGRAQGRKERGPLQFRRSSEARSLRPPKNRADGALCRRGQPRRRRTPTPPRPSPVPPAPHPGLQAAPRPAPTPRPAPGNLADTPGSAEETVGRVAACVPVRSGAPRPAPAPPASDAQDRAGPAPPRPARVGCPTRRPTPLGPPHTLSR